ncbi:hypothetical protein [Candidatus Viadribacter manganicus]|uniref:hypothetical protein n=1 Tax=Candidatus Viadribacter manganicus TaxID=1759059 RepID=UPI0012E9ED22|nr:hypothetical protein [Candidatus Viadribacter manganicus]
MLQRNASRFPSVPLVTVEGVFQSRQDAYETPLRDGGVFDQIHTASAATAATQPAP